MTDNSLSFTQYGHFVTPGNDALGIMSPAMPLASPPQMAAPLYHSYAANSSGAPAPWNMVAGTEPPAFHGPSSVQGEHIMAWGHGMEQGIPESVLGAHSVSWDGGRSIGVESAEEAPFRVNEDALPPLRSIPFGSSPMATLFQGERENEEERESPGDTSKESCTDPTCSLMECGLANSWGPLGFAVCGQRQSPTLSWHTSLVTDALLRQSLRSQQHLEEIRARVLSQHLLSSSVPRPPLAITWHGSLSIDALTPSGKRKREKTDPAEVGDRLEDDLYTQEEYEETQDPFSRGGSGEGPWNGFPAAIKRKKEEDTDYAAWAGTGTLHDNGNDCVKGLKPPNAEDRSLKAVKVLNSFSNEEDCGAPCDAQRDKDQVESLNPLGKDAMRNPRKKRLRDHPVVELVKIGRRMED